MFLEKYVYCAHPFPSVGVAITSCISYNDSLYLSSFIRSIINLPRHIIHKVGGKAKRGTFTQKRKDKLLALKNGMRRIDIEKKMSFEQKHSIGKSAHNNNLCHNSLSLVRRYRYRYQIDISKLYLFPVNLKLKKNIFYVVRISFGHQVRRSIL